MVPGAFTLKIDHEQSRVQQHPLFVTIKGQGFNGDVFDDCWIDPIKNMVLLRPMCKYSTWGSSNSGIFARPGIGAYEFLTGASWAAKEQITGAGEFMEVALSGEWARTATAPGENRGVNLAFFGYGTGGYGLLAEFGWDDTDVTYNGSAIGGRIFSDGTVSIYKAGSFIGSGKIGLSVSGAKNVPIELMLLPCARRELLVIGASNDGFTVVFPDIDETDATPTITPNEKFWFKMVASATKTQVQITPLAFEESGFVTSLTVNFVRPPESGAVERVWANPVFSGITTANVYGEKAYAGATDVSAVSLVEDDGVTAFVADGTLNTARLRVDLEGDGAYTPFIYGAVYGFDGTTALTDDSEEADLDDQITGLVIHVPDDPWGARVDMVVINPDANEATVAGLKTQGNRPGKLECDGVVLMDGRFGEPAFIDGVVDECRTVTMPLFDLTDQLKSYQFRDEFPLDDYYLSRTPGNSSAVSEMLLLAGLATGQMNLSNDGFRLPNITAQKADEFNVSVPIGDDAQQGIEMLHSKFAADWFIGVRPTATVPQFCFLDPAALGTTPKLTLYRTVDAAVTATKPATQVYSSLKYETEEVNANELYVIGRDPRTGDLIQSFAEDEASKDATTAPSLRPDNWLGEPKIYAVADDRLRRQSDCDRLVELLTPVVMSKRTFGEFETPEMVWYDSDGEGAMLPLWRGDYVTLEDYGDVQITAMSVTILLNIDGQQVTRARYTFGGLTNSGGVTLGEIQARNRGRYEIGLLDIFSTRNSLAWQRVRRSPA